MNKERIFRIGTASACEILISDGVPANVVWVQLSISDEGMHLLTIVEHGIVCRVNGNVVSQQYWVNEDDVIEIDGRILNWDYIRGDSNDPFKITSKKMFSNKILGLIAAAVVIVGVALFLILYEKPIPPHIPTSSELYEEACTMLSSINEVDVAAGYEQIECLAVDSIYVPAVLHHYQTVLSAKDTLKWDIAFNRMQKVAKDSSDLAAIYECALCMSYISPKLSLPEVNKYDFIKDKNYEEANRLFDLVIQGDPNNYKAPFWEIINLITLSNGKSLSKSDVDKFAELYMHLDQSLSLSTEELAIQYRCEADRVIKTILQNWNIID